tara:strand:+ start:92 stop:883 length:792 start_codon:yes stop_codon:yes gene_type:complete
MLNHALNKIKKSKLKLEPFPYFVVKNLIPPKELKKLNKILPSFKDINENDIYYQSESKTKKTLLPSSSRYKKLTKNKSFKKINSLFKYLKPAVVKKFNNPIEKYVTKRFQNSNLTFHSTYSVMKNGYIKSPHLDRRDHLVHVLFYPLSEESKGGKIKIMKLKKYNKNGSFDIFPAHENLKSFKSYKVNNNFCLFTLNVPWSYHAVTKYNGHSDRKYFYFVYDFPTKSKGSKLKNRKKGNNQNEFWKSKVSVISPSRKNKFFSE